MSKCEKYRELMNLALDDAITEYERKRLNDHLASCPECRLVNEALRSISEAISEDMVEPPERLVKNVMREITSHRSFGWKSLTAIAACFVLIAAAAGVGFAQYRGTGVSDTDSISAYAQVSDGEAAADEAYDAGELSAGAGDREHGLHSPNSEPEEPQQGRESEDEKIMTDTTENETNSGKNAPEEPQGASKAESADAPRESTDGSVFLMSAPEDVFEDMVSAQIYFSGSVDGTEPDVTLTDAEELELLAELLAYEGAAGIPVPESEALFTVVAVNSSGEGTEIRVWRSNSELLMEFNGELYTVSGLLEDILALIY